jgi:hypothetical protein
MPAPEPCLICQPTARAALDPATMAFVEELVEEYPHDWVPELPCWNCLGAGHTGESQEAIKERLRVLISAEAAGQQRLIP